MEQPVANEGCSLGGMKGRGQAWVKGSFCGQNLMQKPVRA